MVSRICIKNLPKDIEEQKVASHFKDFGPFTDVKLMRTEDGASRRFAFIGFVDPSNGASAIQHFNKTFIGTHRIVVEAARKIGDKCLSRPWSKYSKGSSNHQALYPKSYSTPQPAEKSKKRKKNDESEDDEELKEFLDLMSSSKKGPKWKDTPIEEAEMKEKDSDPLEKKPQEKEISETENPPSNTTSRLFVRNLPYMTTELDLVEAFGIHGEISEVHIVVDKKTKKSKGFAFIEFESASDAKTALKELDGSIFQGRLLHVLPSDEKPRSHFQSVHPAENSSLSSFKKEKEAKLKETIGNRVAWNTFYIKPDTIMEAVADHYQISKSDLMNPDASDLGVRLALGETHILEKTKNELENAGVDISKLEEAAAASGKSALKQSILRSNTTLIVKNLHYHSNETELREMFQSFGEIERFVMPSTHAMAIIQFQNAEDSQRAFRNLAYKKYKSVPLYLEWAPKDLLTQPIQNSQQKEKEDESEEIGVTLYVKNLSFSTKDSDLAKHFDIAASEIGGQLRSARVARKTHSNGTIVSAGFGFVELNSESVAQHVLQKLQDSVLDGHKLQIRRSTRCLTKNAKPPSNEENDETTKLIVKNLAFESTREDVLQLFHPYGQISHCRLPKRFDGRHRGFAFLEFVTKEQAKNAKERISGTHLYGRRLKIEFADSEQSIE